MRNTPGQEAEGAHVSLAATCASYPDPPETATDPAADRAAFIPAFDLCEALASADVALSKLMRCQWRAGEIAASAEVFAFRERLSLLHGRATDAAMHYGYRHLLAGGAK